MAGRDWPSEVRLLQGQKVSQDTAPMTSGAPDRVHKGFNHWDMVASMAPSEARLLRGRKVTQDTAPMTLGAPDRVRKGFNCWDAVASTADAPDWVCKIFDHCKLILILNPDSLIYCICDNGKKCHQWMPIRKH